MVRIVTLGLALAAMLLQIGSYAHLAARRHVTCAEHGELVEAGQAPSAAATADRAESRHVVVAGAATHSHEHCALAPQRRDRATHEIVRTSVTAGAHAYVARVLTDVGPRRAIDLILLAPKNSPPAV